MSRLVCIACIAAASLALAACEQKSDAPPTPAPGAGTTQASAQQNDVPTEQDFEEEAEKEITAANMDGELDKMEKEIGQ